MNEVAQSGDARVKHLTKEAAEFSGQCRISGLARHKASFSRRSFWFSSSAVKKKKRKKKGGIVGADGKDGATATSRVSPPQANG